MITHHTVNRLFNLSCRRGKTLWSQRGKIFATKSTWRAGSPKNVQPGHRWLIWHVLIIFSALPMVGSDLTLCQDIQELCCPANVTMAVASVAGDDGCRDMLGEYVDLRLDTIAMPITISFTWMTFPKTLWNSSFSGVSIGAGLAMGVLAGVVSGGIAAYLYIRRRGLLILTAEMTVSTLSHNICLKMQFKTLVVEQFSFSVN